MKSFGAQVDASFAVPLDAFGSAYYNHIQGQLGPFPSDLHDLLTGASVYSVVQRPRVINLSNLSGALANKCFAPT
jgi:hypothetical protein